MDRKNNFIEKARRVHDDFYDYSLVDYVNTDTKVEIICPIHGIFKQTPRIHLYKKSGCNACAVDRSKITNTKTTEQFIKQGKEVHGDKYDYSKTKYINAHTLVIITCPVHGDFKQRPYVHVVHKSGCKKCAVRLSQEEFVSKADLVHNNFYDYSQIDYDIGKTKIDIICPVHGVFSQRAESHLQGIGCPKCANEREGIYQSQGEIQVREFIQSLGIDIETNVRYLIPPQEIDIFIPSYNLAIEYNGVHWHSELGGKNNVYHLNKLNLCKEKNIHLVQLFENEWILQQDLVKSRLMSLLNKNETIYGRKCKVIFDINEDVIRSFLNKNHIQGYVHSEVILGLTFNNELIGLMTFSHPRFNKKYQWELVRYCNKKYINIVGGANKLLNMFIRKYNPISIISYSDKRWNKGTLYQMLRFAFSHSTNPNYYYFHKNKVLILHSRISFQKHKLGNKLEIFDSSLTEWQNMVRNGYNRIWDCGNDVFVWKNTNTS